MALIELERRARARLSYIRDMHKLRKAAVSEERAEQFGDTPDLQDALAALIAAGRKRATTSLARWCGEAGLPLPRVGEVWRVLDCRGREPC